jgi:hypothetical protein
VICQETNPQAVTRPQVARPVYDLDVGVVVPPVGWEIGVFGGRWAGPQHGSRRQWWKISRVIEVPGKLGGRWLGAVFHESEFSCGSRQNRGCRDKIELTERKALDRCAYLAILLLGDGAAVMRVSVLGVLRSGVLSFYK